MFNESIERTYFMIKPDGVSRGLIGEIISRIEKRGLKIVGMNFGVIDENTAKEHYKEHIGKPFYEELIRYITSGPSLSLSIEGKNAVKIMRILNGSTNPIDASIGSIRGDFCIETGRNLVHASDSIESADRELKIHFKNGNFLKYKIANDDYIYE